MESSGEGDEPHAILKNTMGAARAAVLLYFTVQFTVRNNGNA